MEDQVAWQATPYRAPILDLNGDEFGTAESLLGDEAADIFHGLAVKLSHGGRMVEVSAGRISRITGRAVHTNVRREDVESLPGYREAHWFHLGWGGLFRKHPQWREGA